MKTGCAKIVPIPIKEKSKLEAAMGRDMDSLIGIFRELREIEAMTGRTGLSSRVRVYITGILTSADMIAREELSCGQISGRVKP